VSGYSQDLEGVSMQQPIMFAIFGPVGIWELVIILLIVMLIFGANRLSGLGKGMGQAIRGFKDEMGPGKEKGGD
jgi:sec-independent protein translocase protein TatA